MRSWSLAVAALVALGTGSAQAYEYRLQFTPNAGARGLVVAGYAFAGTTVTGNCSYYTQHSGSGRGGGYKIYKTYYNQTCTWDLYGNLAGITAGLPPIPLPLYTSGTRTIYAQNANGNTTGANSALGGGFVDTRGSHYSWPTSNAHVNLPNNKPYPVVLTLASDGDVPLTVAAVQARAGLAKASVKSTSCVGTVPVGGNCTVNVTFDPSRLRSESLLAYDTLTVSVTSDAGQASDFVQSYTIVVPSD